MKPTFDYRPQNSNIHQEETGLELSIEGIEPDEAVLDISGNNGDYFENFVVENNEGNNSQLVFDSPDMDYTSRLTEEERKTAPVDIKGQLTNLNQFSKMMNQKPKRNLPRYAQPLKREARAGKDGVTLRESNAAYDPFKDAIKYKSVDDDVVDKLLEDYVTNNKVNIPINRIDPSNYLFGTRVISAKIINGVLMIRVGGGFMGIEEFVGTHQQKEILQLRLKMTKERKKLNKITQELLQKHKIKNFI